jgi:hypothetical protein
MAVSVVIAVSVWDGSEGPFKDTLMAVSVVIAVSVGDSSEGPLKDNVIAVSVGDVIRP